MKTFYYLSLCIFFFALNPAQAQEENPSKWYITGYGGIGYGNVVNDIEPNYDLNGSMGELLLNYRLNKKLGLATGIGYSILTGNGFNSIGNFYHERSTLKIPVLLSLQTELTEYLSVVGNFGFYGQVITRDKYQFLNSTQQDNFEGWNGGMQISFGFALKVTEQLSAGISFSGQSDLNTFEPDTDGAINDLQKIRNLSSVGLLFIMEL